MQRITKTLILKIDPSIETRDRDISDTEIRGFGIRIRPNVDPAFYFRYQSPKTKKIRLLSIGSVKDIELETAREIAREYRGYLAKGTDPQDARRASPKNTTILDLYNRYFNEYVMVKNKPSTQHDVDYLWKRHILPIWKDYAVGSITRADVIKLLDSIKSKTSSNRVRSYLSKAFNMAEVWEMRPDGSNPVRLTIKNKEQSRERLVLPEELQRLWKALDAHEISDHPTVVLVRLILLTGARQGELRMALLEHIDWNRKVLVLPDSKTGKGEIELPDEAIDIIRNAKRTKGCKYVVPAYVKGFMLRSPYTAWDKIRAAAGLPDLRLHDLRHVYGTYAHYAGATQKTLAQLLRHTSFSTTERYIQGFNTERRRAAELTAKTLLGFRDNADLDVRQWVTVPSEITPEPAE